MCQTPSDHAAKLHKIKITIVTTVVTEFVKKKKKSINLRLFNVLGLKIGCLKYV